MAARPARWSPGRCPLTHAVWEDWTRLSRRSGPRRRRGRRTGRWRAGRCRWRRGSGPTGSGGGDVVARVGVEAGGLAGGWLVGAGGAGGVDRGPGLCQRSGRRPAPLGRRPARWSPGRCPLSTPSGWWTRLSRRSGPRRRRVQARTGRWRAGRFPPRRPSGRWMRLSRRSGPRRRRGRRRSWSSRCRGLVGAGRRRLGLGRLDPVEAT